MGSGNFLFAPIVIVNPFEHLFCTVSHLYLCLSNVSLSRCSLGPSCPRSCSALPTVGNVLLPTTGPSWPGSSSRRSFRHRLVRVSIQDLVHDIPPLLPALLTPFLKKLLLLVPISDLSGCMYVFDTPPWCTIP